MDKMNEVKKPRKPLLYYYFVILIVILLFNALVVPTWANPRFRMWIMVHL